MIGTKTLATVGLLAVVTAGAFALGSFAPEHLATRGFGTLLFVGCFGVVVGTLVFRFWRFGEKSTHYFRWATEPSSWDASEGHFLGGRERRIVVGENRDGEAFDLSPRGRHFLAIVTAAVLGLAAIGSRALEQLGGAYGHAMTATSSFCPEEEKKAAPVRDPNEPGCELVRRAYALGYAKSLGECAPKKQDETLGVAGHLVCARRQRDEPLLHFSWRLLAGFFESMHRSAGRGYFKQALADFRRRSSRLASLQSAESEMLTSAPHASHHIWTNLPSPGDGAFEERTCTSRYLRLPHRPDPALDPKRASKVFEHVVGQLLFEATYDDAAGHCREYHVHWGAPADACQRLASSPESFLDATGALKDIRRTLDRYRVAGDLVALGGTAPPDPSTFMSFSCYVEAPGETQRTSAPFSLFGRTYSADQLRIAPSPADASLFIDRYAAVARLLVSGFHYGSFLSDTAVDTGSGNAPEASLESAFNASDFLLTRTYELESIDIYLDPGWLANRPDLLDVYPYERHLKNYVEVFRRQYRRERRRM